MHNKSTVMRKYPQVDFQELHLGMFIKDLISNNGVEYSWVAKQLGISPTGLYHRFNSPTYADIYDIIRLSMLLNIDIIALIYKELSKRYPDLFKMQLSENNSYLPANYNEAMTKLQDENKKLYDLISVLKHRI